MKINEITGTNCNINLLVKEIVEKETKNNQKYLVFTLTDGTDEIQAKKWKTDISKENTKAGEVIKCTLQIGSYNGSPDYELKSYLLTDENDNIDIADYIPSAPVKVEVMYQELLSIVGTLKSKDVKAITSTILMTHKEKLLTWSAAKMVHHNVIAGLLYHMYRMAKTAVEMAKIYAGPDLNEDLVIAGVILHDIGKLGELVTDSMGNTEYTVKGELMGHAVLGSDLIQYYGSKLSADKEIVMNLRHIILSHHGKAEWGAVVTPKTMEAKMVSEIDMLDSQLYQYEREEHGLEPGTLTDRKVFGLDSKVYKPKYNA